VLLAGVAPPVRALEVDRDEVALRFVETQQGARIVLEFADRPDYQVRQEPGRVVVALQGSFKSIPYKSKNLDHPAVGRFKLDRGGRQTELIFQTGPEFAAVSSFEMTAPFRLVLDFLRRSAMPPGIPPEPGATPAPPAAEPPTSAEPPVEAPGLPAPSRTGGIQTIVVDPGHGGGETGAKGPTGLLEKDIALDVARRVQQGLAKRLGVKVILTRDSDRQVALDERTAVANHNRADLFLSIHANASNVKEARGAETYFLSYQATDDEARTLAALENNSAGVPTPPGNTNLQLVLWDLAQSQYLAESSQLAETIQRNLNELLSIQSRGIKQAPFRVLMGATMPAVLVEIGFITNAEEEAKLKDPGYRERIANAIVDSVATFKERSEKRQGLR
jgi:N-acetylmuramoyl-L-alanine amidase